MLATLCENEKKIFLQGKILWLSVNLQMVLKLKYLWHDSVFLLYLGDLRPECTPEWQRGPQYRWGGRRRHKKGPSSPPCN